MEALQSQCCAAASSIVIGIEKRSDGSNAVLCHFRFSPNQIGYETRWVSTVLNEWLTPGIRCDRYKRDRNQTKDTGGAKLCNQQSFGDIRA